MRTDLESEVQGMADRIRNESKDFKNAAYLAAAKRVYEKYKDRIVSAEFDLDDVLQK